MIYVFLCLSFFLSYVMSIRYVGTHSFEMDPRKDHLPHTGYHDRDPLVIYPPIYTHFHCTSPYTLGRICWKDSVACCSVVIRQFGHFEPRQSLPMLLL